MKYLKRVLILGMILGVGLFSVGCSKLSGEKAVTSKKNVDSLSTSEDTSSSLDESSQEVISLNNPMEEWESIEDAENCLGFLVKIPDYLPKGYKQVRIDTISQDVLQITYQKSDSKEKSEDELPQCIYRTAQINGDISGDFNQYSQEKTIKINEMDVSLVGNKDLIELARWITEDYSYSIRFEDPVSEKVAKKVIESIQ